MSFILERIAESIKKKDMFKPKIGVWTDGIGVFCDNGKRWSFWLEEGKKYRITIEDIPLDQLQNGKNDIRPVRFFCKSCGKEIWQGVDLETMETSIQKVVKFGCACSDCILNQIIKDRNNNHQEEG